MGEWKTGLFGCFTNPAICCLTMCGPALLFGKNAEAIGENGVLWAIAMCSPCVAALLRTQIRKKKGIDGGFFLDLALYCCCPCCALGQETMELQAVDYLFDDGDLNKVNDQGKSMTRT